MANLFLPQIITWFRLDEHVKRLKNRVDVLETTGLDEAPIDGNQYARQDGDWTEVVTGNAPTLQEVTLEGNITNQDIISSVYLGGGKTAETKISGTKGVVIKTNGQLANPAPEGSIKSDTLSVNRTYQLPDQDGTLYIQPYKVYTALLSQTGTNAPVATVLENTLGTIVWTRQSAGTYLGTLVGAFTENKTFIPPYSSDFSSNSVFLPLSSNGNPQLGWINMYIVGTDVIIVDTYDMVDRSEWSTIVGTSKIPVQIKVYN